MRGAPRPRARMNPRVAERFDPTHDGTSPAVGDVHGERGVRRAAQAGGGRLERVASRKSCCVPEPDQGGPERGGPARGGPERGGPDRGGPARGGPARGGPARGGPERGGPVQGVPVGDGPD